MADYDFRNRAAANSVTRWADALGKKVDKAMMTYGKATGSLDDLRKAIETLQPTFNSMSGQAPIEKALNDLDREVRQITQSAKEVSAALRTLRDPKVKKLIADIKDHPLAK
jgi:hypothetical protein